LCLTRNETGPSVALAANDLRVTALSGGQGVLVQQVRDQRLVVTQAVNAGGAPTPDTGQEVKGFGQHGLGRHNRTDPVGERTTAVQVMRLAAIEERDQRTSIEQQCCPALAGKLTRISSGSPR
jgi:hypothetical protein